MPRFYFDVTDARGHHRDAFGEELGDLEEARQQCQCLLPDLARDDMPDGELHAVACDVRDDAGRVVYRGVITYRGERDPGGAG